MKEVSDCARLGETPNSLEYEEARRPEEKERARAKAVRLQRAGRGAKSAGKTLRGKRSTHLGLLGSV